MFKADTGTRVGEKDKTRFKSVNNDLFHLNGSKEYILQMIHKMKKCVFS